MRGHLGAYPAWEVNPIPPFSPGWEPPTSWLRTQLPRAFPRERLATSPCAAPSASSLPHLVVVFTPPPPYPGDEHFRRRSSPSRRRPSLSARTSTSGSSSAQIPTSVGSSARTSTSVDSFAQTSTSARTSTSTGSAAFAMVPWCEFSDFLGFVLIMSLRMPSDSFLLMADCWCWFLCTSHAHIIIHGWLKI
jgi:hypothetical protein